MPIVEYIRESKQTESAVGAVLKYCTQKIKSMHEGRHLVTGINCQPSTAQQEFKRTRQMHGKDTGVRFYMTIQSFEKGVNLTPSQVHEIGCKLVQEFYPNYEIVVSTHVDREHLHNHFVINSVNIETGIKLHQNKQTLKELRRVSDQIALEYGIQQPIQLQKEKGLSPREYRSAEKGNSWKFKLMNAIDCSMRGTQDKNEFIRKMKKLGYIVNYQENYKHITYTCPNGMKCRDNKLHHKKYLKEVLDYEFEFRRIEREEQGRSSNDDGGDEKISTSVSTGDQKYANSSSTEQERVQSDVGSNLGVSERELRELWGDERTDGNNQVFTTEIDYRGSNGSSDYEVGYDEEEFGRCDGQDEESNVGFIQSNRVSDRTQEQENQNIGLVLGIGAVAGLIDVGTQLDESIDDRKYKRYTRHEKKHKKTQKIQDQEM